MRINLRLAQLLKEYDKLGKRGLLKEIADSSKHIERHSLSAMINNDVKYVSLEALAELCDYLIYKVGVPAASLPGALFELESTGFVEMLANSRDLAFCLGQRHNEAWAGQNFVIATDSHLQAELLARILRCRRPSDDSPHASLPRDSADFHRLHQYFVAAPPEPHSASQWSAVRAAAEERYQWFRDNAGDMALLALGSNKVNAVVELILANAFSAVAFESQDNVALPTDRACPVMFRYRERDPKPASCCGGMRLARKSRHAAPGIYYETENGDWECCPCEDPSDKSESRDAAFVFYVNQPHLRKVALACGGFSGRATGALAKTLPKIVHELWPPQCIAGSEIGLFLIKFVFPCGAAKSAADPIRHEFVRVSPDVIQRRCKSGK